MQKKYGVKISGVGSSLPEKIVKNTDLEKLFDTSDDWIFQRTGIRERRIISGNESGLSLSRDASLKAINNSGINSQDIELIIVATSTPDNLYPSMACMLQGEIGAINSACFDLSAACSGFIYSLVTASQFIYSGTYSKVLVVGVDIHSRFLDWSDRSVSILFGDGAGAVVLSRCDVAEDEILGFSINSSSDRKCDLTLKNNNIFYPEKNNLIKPNTVTMNGRAIFEFGVKVVPQAAISLIKSLGLNVDGIDYFIPHQANYRIIEAAAKKIGFSEEKIISNVMYVGNTSAASIPLALDFALLEKKIKSPSTMLMVGFGAGLTWGSMVLKCNL